MTFGEKFLTNPAQFPARNSGEHCGHHDVAIEFAGGPYLFKGLDAEQLEIVQNHFGEQCSTLEKSGNPAVEIEVYRSTNEEFLTQIYDGTPYYFDADYERSTVRIAGDGFMARIDWAPGLGGAIWLPTSSEPFRVTVPVENFFRALVAYRLLERRGVLLHSAGVVREGKAYLFIGPSGAGKSTISRISLQSGLTVLSDDLNALVEDDEGMIAEKLPFSGDLGQTRTRSNRYPVRVLSRLEQGKANKLTSMSQAESLAALMACSPYTNTDPYRLEQLMSNLEELTNLVQAFRLTFTPDEQLWTLFD